MLEIKDPKRLAAALEERGATDGYQQAAFTDGWRLFEQGRELLYPIGWGPEARDFFSLGYADAAGAPDPAPAVAPPAIDARKQRRFELAKAVAPTFTAAMLNGEIDDWHEHEASHDLFRFVDAVLAALDKQKDGSETA